ncbi:MAG: FAD-dependent oxidoreductase [Streptococcaceae bacterium]|jgi:NADPH-dependent 2,4-dienoyl-CoA reductase/sulfur reductase-like enzyme/rhodanese-related sulfurtransferase|nr:FAD-dependent oxidoreductase [Streptococcaceae bacterium]
MSKYLIIGGVAGGMSAATRLRRLQESAEIIVFEKGPHVSFANCGLPYYISGEIEKREQLIVQSAEALTQRFRLDIRENSEVIKINPSEKTVIVKSGNQTYLESYDSLILSPGAKPILPSLPGLSEAKNIFTLRNIPDLDKITHFIENQTVKQAVVIGAGFIGIEMAENLTQRGLAVTIIEKADHILPTLDPEMAKPIQISLEAHGVRVLTGHSASQFEDDGREILLDDGQVISSGLTLMSVGVQPETTLAADAEIALGLRGGILVNERYETSVKDIYAVGDAIIVKQEQTKADSLISLASPANRQGRQVADILSGLDVKNRGSLGTAIVRVFEQTAASTGLSEQQVKVTGWLHKVVHISANHHAGYYPSASPILLKLIFNPESGAIYGAQATGKNGVDKRVDVIATAIKGGLTIFDLPELELSYAPPFGSAKDPVNMIGYAAMNLALGLSDNIQWYQLADELAQGKVLLDVRNPSEIARGAFKNSLNIPLDELRERLTELDKDQAYIVSCQSGLRSYNAERILKQSGFEVENLDGAYGLYSSMTDALLEKKAEKQVKKEAETR